MTTSIEKIRAEVERVRGYHTRRPGRHNVCQKDNFALPCPTLQLAEDKLKLSEFIDDDAAEPCEYGDNCPSEGSRHGACRHCKAKRALSEVAR